jgi:multidrug efflux pump subunit AcrA (membrane-fusion protein)
LDKASEVPLGSTIKVAIDLPGDVSDVQAVDVPVGSVYDNGKQTGVWVVSDKSTVSFEPIKVLKIGEEDAVITGLNAGTKIVAMGVNLLNDGMPVRLYSEGVASK